MNIKSIDRRKLGLAAFAVALLVGFGLVIARSGPLAPTRVTVAQAEAGELASSIFGIGTVEARRSYFIGPTAAGRIQAVHVDVGDRVEAGQLLAEIDPVDLGERLRSLDAAHARAQSAVTAAEAQRADMRARQKLAAANAERYRDLGRKNFVSTSAVDSRIQEFSSAQAATEASDANLQGARQELARLKADRDGVVQQQRNLRLHAPVAGIVASRDAEPGSTVIAGQSVLRLIAPESLWVKVRVDQGRARGLAVGQPASIVLRSEPGKPRSGKVVRMEPISDSITEERIAQVEFEQLPNGVSVGEMAEVTVRVAVTASTLRVPNAAIRHGAGGTGVWRVEEGRPVFVSVKVGAESLDGFVQIVDGLRAGDTVIVHSERELVADARIKIVDRLAGAAK